MNIRCIAYMLAAALLLGGCSAGVDRAQVADALASAERQAVHLAAFVAATKPAVETLSAAAADQANPETAAAARRMLDAYRAAEAALPAALAAIDQAKARLATLDADGAGKVPWYTVAGGLLLAIVPRVLGALVPPAKPLAEFFADLLWRATATRRQKAADTANPAPKV